MSMNLTEFLRARIAEDKSNDTTLIGVARKDWAARWAAECEAKLRMIEDLDGYCYANHRGAAPCGECGRIGCRNLRLMALPYADHPDFDEAWHR